MSEDAAHGSRWEVFEVVFGVPFLAAIALQLILPVSLPDARTRQLLILGGLTLIVIGLAFVVLARRELGRLGQPTDPGLPTTRLITTGVFSISRNPLYLGGIRVLAGFGLGLNLPWVLLLLLPWTGACDYLLITPEERYLAIKFGEPYQIYTASVHRWIGRDGTSR